MGRIGWNPYDYTLRGSGSAFDARERYHPTPGLVERLAAVHGPLRPIDERWYLVEARLGWRRCGTEFAYPEAILIYAAPDGERVHHRYEDAECDGGDWRIADDVDKHASAVFELGTGQPPTGVFDRSSDQVAAEYREVLARVHGVREVANE